MPVVLAAVSNATKVVDASVGVAGAIEEVVALRILLNIASGAPNCPTVSSGFIFSA